MKKYGVKYPHQANKCFLLLLPDEHECEMGGQQQPSTQTISRNHYACRDVRFFSLEIIFKFLSYGCWESSSVFWWLFCCFVGLGVLRFCCIRAKLSLDSSAVHRTKTPKSFTAEWVWMSAVKTLWGNPSCCFCFRGVEWLVKRWPFYVLKASVDSN